MSKSKSLDNLRKKILNFITDSFDEFDRFNDFAKEDNMHFPDFETFIKHNEKCISKLKSDDLIFLDLLKKNIKKDKINLADAESFVEFGANTFFFNKNKKLVIANPR